MCFQQLSRKYPNNLQNMCFFFHGKVCGCEVRCVDLSNNQNSGIYDIHVPS